MARAETHSADDADLTADPKSFARSVEANSDFRALMANLPERQREVVLLLKVRGLTLDETAQAMGSTIGAIKLTAHRAYKNLRATAHVLSQTASSYTQAN
ncbi:MAG: sigma factor-like helix-turn-helix DNA-binding protein [Bryobacterales bacterium]